MTQRYAEKEVCITGIGQSEAGRPSKKGPLELTIDAAEQAIYKKHPIEGESALMALDKLQGVAVMVRQHHERWPHTTHHDSSTRTARPPVSRGSREHTTTRPDWT